LLRLKKRFSDESLYCSRSILCQQEVDGVVKKNTIRKVKEGDAARRFLGKIIIIKKKREPFPLLYISATTYLALYTQAIPSYPKS